MTAPQPGGQTKQPSAQTFMNQHEQIGTDKQAAGGEHVRQEIQKTEYASVGAMLRQLRKEKGISIRDAAKETNISASNLVAVEHEKYADLPANTFMRGQVAIYGNFLGADGPAAAKQFIAERERHKLNEQKNSGAGRERSSMSAKQLAEPAHMSALTLAAGIIALIILFIAGFFLYTGWNPFSYQKQEQIPAEHLQHLPELEAAPTPEEPPPSIKPAEQEQAVPTDN